MWLKVFEQLGKISEQQQLYKELEVACFGQILRDEKTTLSVYNSVFNVLESSQSIQVLAIAASAFGRWKR